VCIILGRILQRLGADNRGHSARWRDDIICRVDGQEREIRDNYLHSKLQLNVLLSGCQSHESMYESQGQTIDGYKRGTERTRARGHTTLAIAVADRRSWENAQTIRPLGPLLAMENVLNMYYPTTPERPGT